MNQRIIYSTPDGGVAVVIPSGEVPIEQLIGRDVPAGVDYEVVDVDAVPSDRTFRGAWVKGNGVIDHDIAKAQEIAHEKRRAARVEEFAPLDEAIAKKIPGTDVAAVEAQRQAIRDKYAVVQADIDAATDVFELKVALGLEEPAPEPETTPKPEPAV